MTPPQRGLESLSFEVEFPLHASLVLCSDINVDNANKNKSRQLFVNGLISSHTERLVGDCGFLFYSA